MSDEDPGRSITRSVTHAASGDTAHLGPSPADWERVKPVVYHYYIVEKLSLKDVQARLEREHSFRAR